MISMIWAMDENWLIGKDNLLPWHYPNDLKYFKNKTKDQSVLMGDLTYQSLKTYYKTKPLPFKKVYVANILDVHYDDAIHVKDIFEFVKDLKEDIFVIGGRTIYKLMLPFSDRLYITYVLKAHEGNVYFPTFDLSKFRLTHKKMEDQLIFSTYERI
ncbi:MAG: dihydrofolate reductase [Acholeplasmataceae bacterium]|nr:dihydrofolate reductase [Acholeplasmataceae bacterium]